MRRGRSLINPLSGQTTGPRSSPICRRHRLVDASLARRSGRRRVSDAGGELRCSEGLWQAYWRQSWSLWSVATSCCEAALSRPTPMPSPRLGGNLGSEYLAGSDAGSRGTQGSQSGRDAGRESDYWHRSVRAALCDLPRHRKRRGVGVAGCYGRISAATATGDRRGTANRPPRKSVSRIYRRPGENDGRLCLPSEWPSPCAVAPGSAVDCEE